MEILSLIFFNFPLHIHTYIVYAAVVCLCVQYTHTLDYQARPAHTSILLSLLCKWDPECASIETLHDGTQLSNSYIKLFYIKDVHNNFFKWKFGLSALFWPIFIQIEGHQFLGVLMGLWRSSIYKDSTIDGATTIFQDPLRNVQFLSAGPIKECSILICRTY